MSDEMTRARSPLQAARRLAGCGPVLLAAAALVAPAFPATEARAVTDTAPGQDIQLPDNELIDAARDGDVGAIHLAIMRGLSPNDSGIDNIPALIVATSGGHLPAVRYLLENGARPDLRARDGRTALSVAAQMGRADIATVLLDAGADPNQVAENKDTPLMIAVRARRTNIVLVLIARQADLEDTDITGRTPLDFAEEHHFDDIAAILRKAASGG